MIGLTVTSNLLNMKGVRWKRRTLTVLISCQSLTELPLQSRLVSNSHLSPCSCLLGLSSQHHDSKQCVLLEMIQPISSPNLLKLLVFLNEHQIDYHGILSDLTFISPHL